MAIDGKEKFDSTEQINYYNRKEALLAGDSMRLGGTIFSIEEASCGTPVDLQKCLMNGAINISEYKRLMANEANARNSGNWKGFFTSIYGTIPGGTQTGESELIVEPGKT